MQKLRLRSLISPDVSDLLHWRPESLEDVYLLLQLEIGPADAEGADLYQVIVATPEGLRAFAKRLRTRDEKPSIIIEDRATIVVTEYSWPDLQQHIYAILENCSAASDVEAMRNLERYFQGEYENYFME